MTRADEIVDASVLGAAFFNEAASTAAREWLAEGPGLIGPDLLPLEIASIAAKKIWRGEVSIEVGERALEAISDFVSEIAPLGPLTARALALAATHRFSVYDAAYLALAEARKTRVVTLDRRLTDRAREAGLGDLVRDLIT